MFLHQYPIPSERIREIARNNYNNIPIKVDFNSNKNDLFRFLIIEFINKACLNKEFEKDFDKFCEVFSDGMATCLGSGNAISVPSSNHPETIAIINDERHNPNAKEIEKTLEEAFQKSLKQKNRDPFSVINYILPKVYNNELFIKLVYSQRLLYLVTILNKTYQFLDIKQTVESMPDNIIVQYQNALIPIDGNIEESLKILEEIFNPYDSLLTLLIPIVWNISNAPGIKELLEWLTFEMDDIREEPWFKNSPTRTIARML